MELHAHTIRNKMECKRKKENMFVLICVCVCMCEWDGERDDWEKTEGTELYFYLSTTLVIISSLIAMFMNLSKYVAV